MKTKDIRIAEKNWKKLTRWKYDFGCKNIDEVIERILSIVPANQVKEYSK